MGVRAEDLIVRQVGAETVVYDRRLHRAHCLGPLAAAVWRSYDVSLSTAEVARLASEAPGEVIDAAAVEVVLRRLERAGLVDGRTRRRDEAEDAVHGTAARVARREALRRAAALTGLVVLSLAVPSPAQAAVTCIPNGGGPCSSSAECCNACCNANNFKCTGGGPCLAGAGARRR
jgi:hypothetical protein